MKKNSNESEGIGKEKNSLSDRLRSANKNARPPYRDGKNRLVPPDGLIVCEPEWYMLNEKLERVRAKRGLPPISSVSNKNAPSYTIWMKDIRKFLEIKDQDISDQFFYRFKYEIPSNNYVGRSNRENIIADRNKLYAYVFQNQNLTRDEYIRLNKEIWAEWYPDSEIAKQNAEIEAPFNGNFDKKTDGQIEIPLNQSFDEKQDSQTEAILNKNFDKKQDGLKLKDLGRRILPLILCFILGCLFFKACFSETKAVTIQSSPTDSSTNPADPLGIAVRWKYEVIPDADKPFPRKFLLGEMKDGLLVPRFKSLKGWVEILPIPRGETNYVMAGERLAAIDANDSINYKKHTLRFPYVYHNTQKKEFFFMFKVDRGDQSQGFVHIQNTMFAPQEMTGDIYYMHMNRQTLWSQVKIIFTRDTI